MKSQMRKRLLPRAVLVAIVLLALPAAADAPPDQYERFDQDSDTIKDAFTKLEWDRQSVLPNVSLGVDAGCSALTSLGNIGRLPSMKELLTILDEEPHNEYEFGMYVSKMIDPGAFPDTPVAMPYWSSTPAGPGKVWVLSFQTGLMEPMSTALKANARCVR